MQDYERGGWHATRVEVDAWVDSLGARRPERPPKWRKYSLRDRLKVLSGIPGPVDPEQPDDREVFIPFGAAGYESPAATALALSMRSRG
jgi:hypothetical protein